MSDLSRLALVVIEPARNVSNRALEAELRKCLTSKSFSVQKITLLDDEKIVSIPILISDRAQERQIKQQYATINRRH